MKTADIMHSVLANFARAPEVIERATVTFEDRICPVCFGWGKIADAFRGSEREIQCDVCWGKGSVVRERKGA